MGNKLGKNYYTLASRLKRLEFKQSGKLSSYLIYAIEYNKYKISYETAKIKGLCESKQSYYSMVQKLLNNLVLKGSEGLYTAGPLVDDLIKVNSFKITPMAKTEAKLTVHELPVKNTKDIIINNNSTMKIIDQELFRFRTSIEKILTNNGILTSKNKGIK